MEEDRSAFWTSAPGILTGLAAVVTAVTGLVLAFDGKSAADSPPEAVVTPEVIEPSATPPATDPFTTSATISDPDGWTNLRATPSGAILRRIEAGERFQTYSQDGPWWRVRSADGTEGYIHRSRVRLEGG